MIARLSQFALIAATVAALVAPTCSRLLADDPAQSGRQSEPAALATEVRRLVDELQSLRREQSAAEKQRHDELARVRRQIETLTGQLGPAQEAVADQRSQIERLERSLADDRQTATANRAWIERIAAAAAPVAQRAARRGVRGDAPDSPSTLSAFAAIAERLTAKEVSDRAAAIGELSRQFSEEWLPARSVSLTNEQVRLDGGNRAHHAWVYRVGLASRVFASEDFAVVGVSSANSASPWSVDVPEGAARQIRHLIEVVREQKPPAILPVLVRVPPASARED